MIKLKIDLVWNLLPKLAVTLGERFVNCVKEYGCLFQELQLSLPVQKLLSC